MSELAASQPLTVLLIEDNPGDADYVRARLGEHALGGPAITVWVAETLQAACDRLAEVLPDVILLDLSLPDSLGLRTVQRVHSFAAEVPIVVLTGLRDVQMGVDAIREGAQDYYLKDHLSDVGRLRMVMRYAIERKQAELKLERYARQLQQSNEELAQFAHIVSHDLREPLSTISNFIHLLRLRHGDELGEDAAGFLDIIDEVSRRMQRLVKDLLLYARADHMDLSLEPVELEEVLVEVCRDLHSVIEETGACVEYGGLPTVQGDATQLHVLLQNLLSNALKFCDGAPPHVRIGAMRDGTFWRVSVQDNGIGIAEEDQQRIFEAFRRGATREAYPGTGIGLATCHKIVSRHEGTIGVTSAPGEGTTVSFTLPAVDASAIDGVPTSVSVPATDESD